MSNKFCSPSIRPRWSWMRLLKFWCTFPKLLLYSCVSKYFHPCDDYQGLFVCLSNQVPSNTLIIRNSWRSTGAWRGADTPSSSRKSHEDQEFGSLAAMSGWELQISGHSCHGLKFQCRRQGTRARDSSFPHLCIDDIDQSVTAGWMALPNCKIIYYCISSFISWGKMNL